MDKYYLAKLPEENISLEGRSKFVEVELASPNGCIRSFGIVCLLPRSIDFHILELSGCRGSKETRLSLEKRVDLGSSQSDNLQVLAFDVTQQIIQLSNKQAEKSTDCVALSKRGDVLGVDLVSGTTEQIFNCGDYAGAILSRLLECKLRQADGNIVYILAERQYSAYRWLPTEAKNVKQHESYTLSSSIVANFVHIHLPVGDSVSDLILLELDNGFVHLVQGSSCLAQLNLFDCRDQVESELGCLLLLSTGDPHDFLLINTRDSSNSIVGHSIHCDDRTATRTVDDQDPDNLLIHQPSFEHEKLWSIETKASLRLQSDSVRRSGSKLLVPISIEGQDWPHYFAFVQEQNLIIYTFKQRATNPFATIYDSSSRETGALNPETVVNHDLIEPREKPRLLHKFKFTGLGSGETLFNTIFLDPDTQITTMRHFCKSHLLAALLSSGDLLAFRLTSDDFESSKSPSSELLIESISCSSRLLSNVQDQLKAENMRLRNFLQQIESSTASQKDLNLSKPLRLSLVQDRDNKQACLYKLVLDISSLIQVSQVLIITTVSLHLLEPFLSSGDAQITLCDRNNGRTDEPVVTLANMRLENLINMANLNLNESISEYSSRDELVQSWTVIELENLNNRFIGSVTLNCPLFLSDGQRGSIDVYCCPFEDTLPDGDDFVTSKAGYFSSNLQIKPLISYQVNERCSVNELTPCLIIEELDRSKTVIWLNELIDLETTDANVAHLYSALTGCCLHIELEQTQTRYRSVDILALDVIRRHLLKKATDEALQLKVSTLKDPGSTLSTLLTRQHENLCKFYTSYDLEIEADKSLKPAQSEMIIELLIDQVSSFNPTTEVENLLERLKSDVNSLGACESSACSISSSEQVHVYSDMVTNHITDMLIDFNHFLGGKIATQTMIAMRDRIYKSVVGFQERSWRETTDKETFVRSILQIWHEAEKN